MFISASFLVAFLSALVVCAIPMYYMEVVVSQYSGRGMFNVWGICPLIKGKFIKKSLTSIAITIITDKVVDMCSFQPCS